MSHTTIFERLFYASIVLGFIGSLLLNPVQPAAILVGLIMSGLLGVLVGLAAWKDQFWAASLLTAFTVIGFPLLFFQVLMTSAGKTPSPGQSRENLILSGIILVLQAVALWFYFSGRKSAIAETPAPDSDAVSR